MAPSSKPHAIPTYHVVPRFDIAAKGGALELGTVVDSLSKLRPLNRGGIVPIPPSLSYEPVKHNSVTEKWSHLRKGQGSAWARAFADQVLGASVEASAEDDAQCTVKCDELVTLYFDPNQEYVAKSLATTSVHEYFSAWSYERDVYMITGLKIAKNLRIGSSTIQKRQGSKELNAREPKSGIGLGARVAFQGSDEHSVELEVHDIVVGFRVRRYAYVPASWNVLSKKKKLEGDDYLVHAELYEFERDELTSEAVDYCEVPIEEELVAQEENLSGDAKSELWIG